MHSGYIIEGDNDTFLNVFSHERSTNDRQFWGKLGKHKSHQKPIF